MQNYIRKEKFKAALVNLELQHAARYDRKTFRREYDC